MWRWASHGGRSLRLVAFYLARRMTRPLDDMQQTAERLAAGDLGARVALPEGVELAGLARTLNLMRRNLANG